MLLCDFIAKSHQQATMLSHRRAVLALTVLVVAAAAARAQDAAPDRLDPALGLKPRLQESLLPPVAPGQDEDLPVFVEADRIQGTQGVDLEADGNVVMRRRGEAVFADQLRYLFQTQDVTLTGNVRFDRLGDIITGDRAVFNLKTESGNVDNPTYRFRQFHARGQASELIIRDRDRYRAIRATYTNCDVGRDDWYMKVQRLDIDRLRDVGVAHNATLYFEDVPIMYTPWMDFPISSRRKSGFLPPTFGTSGSTGFEFLLPYYWDIKPNMDYTVAPRVMAKRGVMLDNEFRYLEPKFKGQIEADILPDDRATGTSRWFVSLLHTETFARGLTGGLNLQKVSDNNYFTDFSASIALTSQSVLPQEAWLNYEGGWWRAYGRVEHFQTINTSVFSPYSQVPQVTLVASQQDVRGFDPAFSGSVVNFEHPTLLSGWRQTYYPSVTYPWRTPLFYVTPKIGFNFTHYDYPGSDVPAATRSLPILSVDSGMSFERDTTIGGRDFAQTLEPRLYYLYIPFRNQDQLPIFDSSLKDFNFTTIFSENIFSGGDRINNANQVTAAAISRLIDPATGVEQLRVLLGQRYYFTPQDVTLFSTLPTTPVPNVGATTTSRSDLLAAFSGKLTPTWSLDTGIDYGVNPSQVQRFDVALRDQPEPGKVLNLSYRYTRDYVDQIDISAQWPLSRRWAALARWNYSLQPSSLLEGLLGLEYNHDCWVLRFVIHRFVTATDTWSNQFFVQLELTGLSRLGSNPFQVLRQGIGGYTAPTLRSRVPGEYYPGMDEQ
jgi:LPS-assembly protein